MRDRVWAAFLLGASTLACAQPVSPPAPDGELALVVAVFRHGVRAPLSEFAAKANDHTGESWPRTPADWGAKDWGDLTRRGAILAARLGEYYGTACNIPLGAFNKAVADAIGAQQVCP